MAGRELDGIKLIPDLINYSWNINGILPAGLGWFYAKIDRDIGDTCRKMRGRRKGENNLSRGRFILPQIRSMGEAIEVTILNALHSSGLY